MLRLAEPLLGATLAAAVFATHAALPSSWTITELDSVRGYATAISDSGFIVSCGSVNGFERAFIWSNGSSRELSPELPAESSRCAYAVNNAGMAAGVVDGQAAVWSNGALMRLPVTGEANAINEAGQVVGIIRYSPEYTAPTHAFTWRQGVLVDLHPPGARSSAAVAVNEAGQVAGMVDSTAVIWENGGMRTIGSGYITVGGMNDRGEVVGLYMFDNEIKRRAFIFNGTLSGLPGAGWELSVLTITNGGRVLVNGLDGYTTIVENGESLSFEFMPSIRAAGWKRLEPTAMNERGWIIGSGIHNNDGYSRNFLIVPVEGAPGNPTARSTTRTTPLIRAAGRG